MNPDQTQTAGHSPFAPPPPPGAGQRCQWQGLHAGAAGLAVARAASTHAGLTVVAARDTTSAERWLRELGFYAADLPRLQFPDWETLAYDAFSPHQDIVSERLTTLMALRSRGPDAGPAVLVVPVQTLLQRVVPPSYVDGYAMALRVGQRYDIDTERRRLEAAGYAAVDTVTSHGEYAVRGALMDLFPMGSDVPVRVDLFDDEIESLRTFDPETQRTLERLEQIRLLPAREFPLDDEAIARFRDRWHNTFNVDVRRASVYQDVSRRIPPGGVEYYLPFFYDALASLFDYLPAGTLIVEDRGADAAADHFLEDVARRYESLRHDVERPILPPDALYLRIGEMNEGLNRHGRVQLDRDGRHPVRFASAPIPDLEANPRARDPAQALTRYLSGAAARTLFVADTAGRREVFWEFLSRAGIQPPEADGFDAFLAGSDPHGITIAPLDEGLDADGVRVVTESEVFGHQVQERRRRTTRVLDPEQIIKNLTELHIGEPVVHVEHGIGRYQGLQTLEIDGTPHEFLTLEYADQAKLYVPVTSLHLISRYAGAEEGLAPLHRLGSDQWEKAKRKAAEKAYDAAAELLSIYARREANPRFRFDDPGADYQRFAEQFPFELTPDQQTAIDETIADLCSDRATDRLICGDVGFGKTEVAMRAAFVAVQSGKQVAVLVPTTLLAQQHYETLRDRFADWPVQIESLSRLRSDSEIDAVAARMESGAADIVVGTHKLLSHAKAFKDLGLVIIDEEHRFGVRQKERLKALRAEVDVITLTATPIPRTLNLAMSGLRELSIIATPPARRLSIKTFVMEKRTHVTDEAISRELMRGGQVFYLHNEVKTIETVAEELAARIPEARVGVGHGQMPKRDLERVMNDFYHRQLNILVCTTIIENGIDIPNANTIIIERADKFGLAQLHQLRGRVGRSHRQAYAYLLTPHRKAMTADAVKRLEAIEAAGELGVGFTLATHDMEIRGAGALLGEEQSGQIESVGFSLYTQMLDRAVRAIREGRTPDLDAPLEPVSQEVNLHVGVRIPDDYLPDVHARLILYKRISNAENDEQLDDLRAEVVDRFGPLPEPLRQLFRVTALKLHMQPLGIRRLDLGAEGGRVEFNADTSVDPGRIVALVQQQTATYRLDGATQLRITRRLADFDARLAFAGELLDQLAPAPPARRAAGA
ncbi:MAG: transcription-repair coupling factor [Gammaproteobacteria bacterium]|nr:transcription-repair coupling factor [Gammaproteobacteria bacterium]